MSPPMAVPGAGRGGGGGSSSDDFSDSELRAMLAGSLPDHHLCVVGSLGALPASLGGWPAPAAFHAPPLQALGDLESGRSFAFYPPDDADLEGEEGQEGEEECLKQDLDGEAAAPAGAAAHAPLDAPPPLDAPLSQAAVAAAAASKPPSETLRILALAAPLSLSNLAGYAISMIALAFVGRLGEGALSVAVLATSFFNVTGLAVLIGFASAMETFCSQAMGAGRPHLLGLVLQRALLLLSLLALLVAAAWTQVEPLLLALGQDPVIAHGTARFMLRATPALWFTAIFEALKRYLMAQEAVRPATVVTAIALCLSPLYNWLFIFKLGGGVYGAAYALDLTQATLALLLGAYCVARDRLLTGSPLATWHGLSRQAWHGWSQYCRFALPSVAMLCCEWSTFEVMVLMSGVLPKPAVSVSAMGLTINTSGLSYMAVTGLACAASVRAGHALGAGRPADARRSTWTAWRLTMCLQAAVAGAIVLARSSWPRIFTNSSAVVARTAQLLPLFALSLFGDGTNAVLQGLLRGAGRQHLGAITNLLSYWCCGIPLAAYLAFKRGLGLEGLWWGLVCINTVQGGIMLTLAWRFDFEGQAERAAALLQQAAAARGADPLLQPLLAGGEEGAPGRRGATAGGPGRRRGSGSNAEGVKQRLSQALMLLLTEGAPQRRARLAAGGGGPRAPRRTQGAAGAL